MGTGQVSKFVLRKNGILEINDNISKLNQNRICCSVNVVNIYESSSTGKLVIIYIVMWGHMVFAMTKIKNY